MSNQTYVEASAGTPENVDLEAAQERARNEQFGKTVEASTQVHGDQVAQEQLFTN